MKECSITLTDFILVLNHIKMLQEEAAIAKWLDHWACNPQVLGGLPAKVIVASGKISGHKCFFAS